MHGRHRNLVVAATGTGKTVVAAFDYVRLIGTSQIPPRLLFLAHRKEILDQARLTFRHALHDGAFGELLVAGDEPAHWDHVFATVQSAASRVLLGRFGPEHFQYVVIDECHHAPADSYRALIPHLRPNILLGLTATPERTDGKSLLPDFDGHIAAELRLWHALDRQLLVPFEYYGISDNTDLSRVRWTRTGYDVTGLAGVYTGNDARVDLVIRQLQRRVGSLRGMRALAFCVSVEHAEFMAKAFTERGLPAIAIHGDTVGSERIDAPRRLRELQVNVLCTCESEPDSKRLTMLGFQLHSRGVVRTATETLAPLSSPAMVDELSQLVTVLEARVSLPQDVYPVADWPLALHRHYRRQEIAAAVGYVRPGAKGGVPQAGILKLEDRRELLFITLDKSARSFSPTTRYRDYAISPTLFHWETQSIASVLKETGRRYVESPANGWTFFLFVRTDPDAPHAFCGAGVRVSHEGDRPIAITWRLETALPAALYQRYATLAQG